MTIRALSILSVILALTAAMMLGSLGRWPLKGSDEPRYAQIAREMLETGQYILPHLNGHLYPDKPPLYFWLVSLLSKPFGDVGAHSARLPAALAACGMLVVLFLFGRCLFDTYTGMLAAGILFITEQFFSSAISARLDTLFTFWILLALYCLYQGCLREPSRRSISLCGWACMAAAVLTKGPVGIVVPLLIMVFFLLLTKRSHMIRRLSWLSGSLLAVILCCLWLVPACLQGGVEYTRNILLQQSFGRVIDAFAHKAPFYFYLLNFPIDFLPWTLFLPVAALYLWRTRAQQAAVHFPFIWAITVLVFFSCISGKRNLYLLPLYPAAALCMAKFFADIAHDERVSHQVCRWKLMIVPCYLIGSTCCAAGIGLGVMATGIMFPFSLPSPGPAVFASVGCGMFAGGVYGIVKLRRKQMVASIGPVLIGLCAMLYCLILWFVLPVVDNHSERAFCEKILQTVQPHDPLYASFEPEYFNYFLHRYPIPVVRDHDEALQLVQSEKKIYFLLKDRDFNKLPHSIRQHLSLLAAAEIGHKTIFFASNRTSS